VTLVEGAPGDRAKARASLAALQQQKRLAFGGFFADGTALAVVATASAGEAIGWLGTAGGWDVRHLRARAWSQTL